MKQLKVYIADDHTLFRKAMVNLLRSFERVSDVKDAENGKDLLTLIKYETPDVVIVDLQMPVMDGSEASAQIINKFPEQKIRIRITDGNIFDNRFWTDFPLGASCIFVFDSISVTRPIDSADRAYFPYKLLREYLGVFFSKNRDV